MRVCFVFCFILNSSIVVPAKREHHCAFVCVKKEKINKNEPKRKKNDLKLHFFLCQNYMYLDVFLGFGCVCGGNGCSKGGFVVVVFFLFKGGECVFLDGHFDSCLGRCSKITLKVNW